MPRQARQKAKGEFFLDGRYLTSMGVEILIGDVRSAILGIATNSVHCVVTSPPYWGLRDYGVSGQIGLEPTYHAFIAEMVAVFREVRRVLRPDGTCWVNLGDSYAGSNMTGGNNGINASGGADGFKMQRQFDRKVELGGLKPKDLCGIPWRVAFALQEDGWWLRQDIIWSKPNPMPESCTDRCTKSHEYLFLLTKSARYFYDAEAIKEPLQESTLERGYTAQKMERGGTPKEHSNADPLVRQGKGWWDKAYIPNGRNRRSVWEIATSPFPEAHFATFPPALVEPCIKAGTSEKGCCSKCGAPWVRKVETTYHNDTTKDGRPRHDETLGWSPSCKCYGHLEERAGPEDWISRETGQRKKIRVYVPDGDQPPPKPCTILDPFAGAGTTGLVADRLQRHAILIELNPQYAEMARQRIANEAPLLSFAGPPDHTTTPNGADRPARASPSCAPAIQDELQLDAFESCDTCPYASCLACNIS